MLNRVYRILLLLAPLLVFLAIGFIWTQWTGQQDPTILGTARFIVTPLAAFGLAVLVGARYVQDIYEIPNYLSALHYMVATLSEFFLPAFLSNFFLPTLRIADGQEVIEPGGFNVLDRIGGPGFLIMESGNIVLLERLDSPADMLSGQGFQKINRFHRIKNIISLKDQNATPRDVMAITKDGILVNVKDFQFGYRLETSHRLSSESSQRTILNPYPFSIKAAKDLTYNRSITKDGTPVEWDKAVQFSIDGAITEYINKHYLNQLIFPAKTDEDPRRRINSDIEKKRRVKMYGSELLWHDIGPFEIDPAINEQMTKAWNEKLANNIALIEAQGEAAQIASEERARAEGEINLLRSIIKALDDAGLPDNVDENMWNIVLSGTAQVIESMTNIYKKQEPLEPEEE
jgi:hypothetical protein